MSTKPIVVWSILPVKDLDASQAFYDKVFGWSSTEDMDGPNRSILLNGEMDTVGANLIEGDTAPGTITHFMIPDTCEAAAARVTDMGGKVFDGVTTLPVGRFMVAQDLDGNMLGLFEPKAA